jgi:hypothetical protein
MIRGVESTHYNIVCSVEVVLAQAYHERPHLDYQTFTEIAKDEHKIIALCHTPLSHISVNPPECGSDEQGHAFYVNATIRSVLNRLRTN